MKRAVRVFLAVAAIAFLAPYAYPVGTAGTFRVRVVRLLTYDTAEPLPDVQVTVENGPTKTTEFDGSVLFWLGPSQLNHNVRFQIQRGHVQRSVLLSVEPGGLALVTLED